MFSPSPCSDSTEAGRQAGVEFSPRAVPHKRLIATAQPLVGAQGQMAFGTLVVLRDASREYLALQAGNDFVAHVSHELKSPLNVIAIYAETLQDAQPDDHETRVLSINVIQWNRRPRHCARKRRAPNASSTR